eukprot:gb/GFBE01041755.1/.p1 GENE.gb/GFBE01041755.1/~~gb/GFBE01041755.1/.p1  ORF type:complete len:1196 (+),score=268.01 gb/GFBE01041755.1/:1-3588(+)
MRPAVISPRGGDVEDVNYDQGSARRKGGRLQSELHSFHNDKGGTGSSRGISFMQAPVQQLQEIMQEGAEDEYDTLNTDSVEDFKLDPQLVKAAKSAFTAWLDRSRGDGNGRQSEEGENIFLAIFETAPNVQALFDTPMGFHAHKFLEALTELVRLMDSPTELRMMVEMLGFQHANVEFNHTAAKTFRIAILLHVEAVLKEQFSHDAKHGLSALINYVCGALMCIKKSTADRITLLTESWKLAHEKENEGEEEEEAEEDEEREEAGTGEEAEQQEGSGEEADVQDFYDLEDVDLLSHDSKQEAKGGDKSSLTQMQTSLPTTFNEMFQINAAVMGFQRAASQWMTDVLDALAAIVTHLDSTKRVQEESLVLVMRLSFYDLEQVVLSQFKSSLLAALRSTLPKDWSTAHEEAWSWLWDNLVQVIEGSLHKPMQYWEAIEESLGSMSQKRLYKFRSDIYTKFFQLAPIGQNYFKQSSTRLHFIAERVLTMTGEFFNDPLAMVSDISALGLRHVGFGIPTNLFNPFVTACVQVMGKHCQSGIAQEAFEWSLVLISKVLTRTIIEGSTVVMTAINANSSKIMAQAIAAAPRGQRATWLLHIQVGDQFISPLMWAIESGSMQVADAMLRDLLTIRADRARYYYGADELFERHPDIIQRLAERAPDLLRTLLDGLIWRSHHTSQNGQFRRVNYYLKNMLLDQKGRFSEALKHISATGDPNIVIHPVVALMVETLWTGIVRRQFMYSRLWNIISLIVFILSQEGIPAEESKNMNMVLFGFRVFSYTLGILRLGILQMSRVWVWARNEFRKILAEIDTDGNGEIDYDELMEVVNRFNCLVKSEARKVLRLNRDGDELAGASAKKASSSNKQGKLYNRISFTVIFLLICMLTQEPMILCSGAPNWPTTLCPENAEAVVYAYSILGMMAMIAHYLMLIDLAVFSTEISAFLLVVGSVMGEMTQFLTALTFLLLLFGSTISIHCRTCPVDGGNFSDMPNAIITLFSITVGLYQGDFRDIQEDPILLVCVFSFVTFSVILLLNLLIAQLNRTYEYIYQDMLGFAQLNRASLIVDAMANCPKGRWKKFVSSMQFDERREFDEGDLGLPGCIQVVESAARNRLSVEMIKRYGGTTSRSVPWPEDRRRHTDLDTNSRLDLLEQVLTKTLKRMSKFRRPQPSMGPGGVASGFDPAMESDLSDDDSIGGDSNDS